MKTLWSTIWTFLLVVCGLVWYAIDGWAGVAKAVLTMCGLGLMLAGLLRMWAERKQCGTTLIEQHEGFDAWHQALCSWTRQKFSVEEAYAMWRRKLYEHPDLGLLYAGQPVAEMSEEE